jgi:transcriptional regulator with XRE-family HTH domain
MEFREKLRKTAAGLNKAKVGRAVGLQANTISSYIATGSVPRGDIALKIARALDVPLEWLVDDSQDWPPPLADAKGVATSADSELMEEACRRLANVAARVESEVTRLGKIDWPTVAAEALAVPVDAPLPPAVRAAVDSLYPLGNAIEELASFDASRVLSRYIPDPPDVDRVRDTAARLRDTPELDAVWSYRQLRALAEGMKRRGDPMPQSDAEAHRKRLLAILKKPGPAGRPAKNGGSEAR